MSQSGQDIDLPSGIHQLKLPFPKGPMGVGGSLGYLLAYLVEIEGGYVLIDTGWEGEDTLKALTGQLDGIGVGFDEIRYVLVTHHHLDHMGQAAEVRERSGAWLVMHSLEMPGTIKDYYMSLSDTPSDWFRDWLRSLGMPQGDLDALPPAASGMDTYLPPTSVDIIINGGESRHDGLADLEAIWTPGHSPGHVCIYDRRRKVLFSGDHVLPGITPHISLQPHVGGNPLGDYLSSLRTLQGLAVSLVLPAHEYAFTDMHGRIAELLEHHRVRLAEILGSLGSASRAPYEVCADVAWDVGGWGDMSPWLRQMGLFETLAHLEHLRSEGKVDASQRQGRTYYQAK